MFMNIFLRFIFINYFLLVAIHSLIFASEGNYNESDNQSLIKKTTEPVFRIAVKRAVIIPTEAAK